MNRRLLLRVLRLHWPPLLVALLATAAVGVIFSHRGQQQLDPIEFWNGLWRGAITFLFTGATLVLTEHRRVARAEPILAQLLQHLVHLLGVQDEENLSPIARSRRHDEFRKLAAQGQSEIKQATDLLAATPELVNALPDEVTDAVFELRHLFAFPEHFEPARLKSIHVALAAYVEGQR